MPTREVIVLKLGGSVLTGEDSIQQAVGEVRRWVRLGYRVVAVVSAFEGHTDRLLASAARFGREPWSTAALVATGELTSAAVLALALEQAGTPAATLDAAALGLRTSTDPLNADPESLDADALRRALGRHDAVIVPGFIGRDESGRTTLLGRGGSDLTALFIAGTLSARCRLVKDVPGLFDRDPKHADTARLYARLHWDDALQLDGGIVQHKGVRLAKGLGLVFEVGTLGATFATHVGEFNAEFVASITETVHEEVAA